MKVMTPAPVSPRSHRPTSSLRATVVTFLAVFVAACAVLVGSPSPAHAAISVDAFVNKYHGQKVTDPGGTYYGECVSLVKRYNIEVVGGPNFVVSGGRAKSMWTDYRSDSGWGVNYTKVSASNAPKRGDIAVIGSGDFGHVGIVLGTSGSNLLLFDQQNAAAGLPSLAPNKNGRVLSKAGLLGYLRPKKLPASVRSFSAPNPVVAGDPVNGKTLTANHGTWTPTPSTRTYQWLRSGTAIKGATAKTYTLTNADVGKTMSVKVTGKKSGYTTLTKTSKATAAVKGKALTAAPTPTITGQAEVDQKLTVGTGAWGPSPVSLSYQWLRDGTAINGATASTLTLVQADIGKAVSVRVSGKKTGYVTQSKTSAARTVTARTITTGTPTISGTARIDETLTADPGTWESQPVNLTYQWKRDGAAIPGATATTYTLVGADVGRVITVAVTGSKNGHQRTTNESAATAPAVAESLTGTPTPTVSGSPVFDSVLTADAGTWAPALVELRLQWLRNGTPISGATASTYRLTTADVGATVSVSVTGRKSGYLPVTRTSTPTAKVAAKTLTSPTPTVSGSAKQSSRLTAVSGTWTSGTKLAYQWRRDGAAIGGATGSTYTPVERDIGKRLTVTVTGSKAGHTTVARTSKATAVVSSATGDRITRGKSLKSGVSLYSPNGRYKLTQQTDGNLVLRNIAGSSARVIWASGTNGRGVAYVVMQNDGNLVQYTKGGGAVWSTKTNGKGGDRLVVQNDGNTVIYTAGGKAVWATNTKGR